MRIYPLLKRIIDIVFSLAGIIILSPILLLIAIIIKMDSNGPVLFRQKRVSRGRKVFDILKFRTMRKGTPKYVPSSDLENPYMYITRIGAFLRKTSLDELPQLFNILRGDMSFVGPRPVIPNEGKLLELRDGEGVSAVRPGLTGWAQINGRDEMPPDVKSRYDAEYVKRMSFKFDLYIMVRTLIYVLSGKGIVEGKHKDGAGADKAAGSENPEKRRLNGLR